MAVPPNLVVGLVGLLVFVGTGSIIVADFKDLTGTRDYVCSVRTFTRNAPPVSNTIGPGAATRIETFPVADANVTHVLVRVTWDETGLPIAQHTVTVSLTNPRGTAIGVPRSGQGAAGVTIDERPLAAPQGARFSATEDGADAAFQQRYPAHDEGRGTWAFKVATNTPAQPGAGVVRYTITFQTEHYVADMRLDTVVR